MTSDSHHSGSAVELVLPFVIEKLQHATSTKKAARAYHAPFMVRPGAVHLWQWYLVVLTLLNVEVVLSVPYCFDTCTNLDWPT